ncbi:MAG: hypothetical protein Q8K37_06710 [Alphaproteobacteria bacterium]|nr:hypothetical protein [Alphaproteobacteria bacterium]MDP1975643.1 hypothetical protein [Alphaproteobacteria bacterium]
MNLKSIGYVSFFLMMLIDFFVYPMLAKSFFLPNLAFLFIFLTIFCFYNHFFILTIIVMQFVSELLFYESYGFKTSLMIAFLILCENVYAKAKLIDFFSLWQKFMYLMILFCFFESSVNFIIQKQFLSFYECLLNYITSVLFFPIAYSLMCSFQRNPEHFRE